MAPPTRIQTMLEQWIEDNYPVSPEPEIHTHVHWCNPEHTMEVPEL